MMSGWIKFVVLAALVCVSLSEKENSKKEKVEDSTLGEVGEPIAFLYEPLTGELITVPVTRVVEEEEKAKDVSKRWLFRRRRRRRRRGRGSVSANVDRSGVHVGGQYTNGRHRLSGGYTYGPNGHSLGLKYTFGGKK